MTPAYRIRVGDSDVTQRLRERGADLRLTSTADRTSDNVEIAVADAGGVLALPATGREFRVSIGYAEDDDLAPMGVYFHGSTDIELVPRRLTIRATAADLRRNSALKAPRTRAWDDVTLGEVVDTIAAEHGYNGRCAPSLATQPIAHIDQTAESDLHLLRRLAQHYDATTKATGGYMLFMPRGSERSAGTAEVLPTVEIGPAGVIRGRVSRQDRSQYGAVRASYHDIEAGALLHVQAGTGTPVFEIQAPRPDRPQAEAAAAAQLTRLNRQSATLSLTVPGDPALVAESRVVLSGWGEGVDGTWSVSRAVHSLTKQGDYTSEVSAELAA